MEREKRKITPVHARNYSDYTRRVGLAPRGAKNRVALHDSRRGPSFSVDHAAINERETVRSDDYYNIGGLK